MEAIVVFRGVNSAGIDGLSQRKQRGASNTNVAKTGTLTFAPGETTRTITIAIKKEADETFYLDLFGNSSISLFSKSRGSGAIVNRD